MIFDSNLIIYSVQLGNEALLSFMEQMTPSVSEASEVEVLGFHELSPIDKPKLEKFFATARLLPISRAVNLRAISLRQARNISLGDALISATALVHDLELQTYNLHDFRGISGLRINDPIPALGITLKPSP